MDVSTVCVYIFRKLGSTAVLCMGRRRVDYMTMIVSRQT